MQTAYPCDTTCFESSSGAFGTAPHQQIVNFSQHLQEDTMALACQYLHAMQTVYPSDTTCFESSSGAFRTAHIAGPGN